VIVKKKTGKWRLCVDFRQINAKSVKDANPMPRINYILDQLKEAPYISSLDLKDGYWQIPQEDSSSFSEFWTFAYQDDIIVIGCTLEKHKRNPASKGGKPEAESRKMPIL